MIGLVLLINPTFNLEYDILEWHYGTYAASCEASSISESGKEERRGEREGRKRKRRRGDEKKEHQSS